jgi:hypothetical protein
MAFSLCCLKTGLIIEETGKRPGGAAVLSGGLPVSAY